MLLHLPIVIMATLSPVAVSDTVPKFDIVKECRFEGGSTVQFDRCSEDDLARLRALVRSGLLQRPSPDARCSRLNP